MEIEKNDVIECIIDDMGAFGEGITHIGGLTVFIPGALIGEKVSARVVLAKPSLAHAVLVKIISPSPYRVEPPCPYFRQCGGCSLQHLHYDAQLRLKQSIVANSLRKYAGIEFDVDGTVPSPDIFGYRNKLSLPVRYEKKRGTVCGLFAKKSHRIVEVENCLLQRAPTFDTAKKAFDFARSFGLEGYDEESGKGDIRHIIVRSLEDEISLTYVLNGEKREFERALELKLAELKPKDLSVHINRNTAKNNVILGNETRLVYGRAEARLGDMAVETHPQAFFQVNGRVREKLYGAALAEVAGCKNVVDAYSGAGIMSALFARKAKRVVGIEISEAAVEVAKRLAKREGLENLSFVLGDCAEKIGDVLRNSDGKETAVVLDPPKSGCAEKVIESLVASLPEKIVYISCNPATLARDLNALLKGGFELVSVTPYDMFPQTTSIETLVVLSKKIPDSHINIDVEFGESEGQFSLKKIKERAEARKPKEKVTYKMIQEYIEQTYSFKVHTAYIAEVKRDLGLPMYDAPNAVEELKHPRPHPTPKMVEAIKETLKHFEII